MNHRVLGHTLQGQVQYAHPGHLLCKLNHHRWRTVKYLRLINIDVCERECTVDRMWCFFNVTTQEYYYHLSNAA